MQSTRGAAVCAAIALMAAGLTACGEDKPVDPTTTASPISVDTDTSTSSSSSSSSSSTSATGDVDLPKDYPAEAQKETKAGAAAFGKYYYEAFGDATDSGDTSVIEALQTDDCGVCNTAVDGIQKDKRKGWTRSENPYAVSNLTASKRTDSGYKVAMSVKVAAHTRVDSKGKSNAHVKATSYTLTEHVVWRDGRWQMQDWIVT